MDDKTQRMVIPADRILPNKLVIVPVRGKPIFPGVFTPLMITDKQDVASIDAALSTDSLIGLVLVQSEEIDEPTAKDLSKLYIVPARVAIGITIIITANPLKITCVVLAQIEFLLKLCEQSIKRRF